ncbi:MAG: IS6 family transposase [Thaumarchaeota archaeon]|nr:IS6 family transposase [Nitrososphaerota archaeon]
MRWIRSSGGALWLYVWKWVQWCEPHRVFDVGRVQVFLVDETYVKIGASEAWVWVAVEPVHRYILGVYLSRHQNILVAELFLKSLVEKYGKHPVYSGEGTWYPEACRTLELGIDYILIIRRA